MEEIQLKDICDLDNGYAFKSDDYVEKSGTLNCRMSNIRPDGTFDILYSAKYLPDEFADKYEEYILHDGDLIIAMTDMAGDPKILGVPTVVNTQGYTLLLNQRVGRLRFIKNGVNADYLKLALQCPRVRNYLKRFAGGGVQLNVSKKDILSAPVRMCNEKEQTYVADIFKSVLEIKAKREHELQLLDDLIKARFVEMFGCGNDDMKTIDDIANICRGASPRPISKFVTEDEDGVNWIKIGDVTEDDIYITRTSERITKEGAKKSRSVEPGDFILSNSMSFGRPYISGISGCVHDGWLIISDYQAYLDPLFFYYELRSDLVQKQFDGSANGSCVKNLNSDLVKKVKIHIPPMDKQKEFEQFAKQVDKSKVAIQKSLDETQLLFDSLMQKYFG